MNKVLSQEEIDALFSAMSRAGMRLGAKPRTKAAACKRPATAGKRNIDIILRQELPLSICFRNSRMPLEEALKLGIGSFIQLNKSIHDPVTVCVNHRPIAKGEFVTVSGNHGVRIIEVESATKRVRSLW